MTFTEPASSRKFASEPFADLCQHTLAPVPVACIGRDETSDTIVESQHLLVDSLSYTCLTLQDGGLDDVYR